MRSNILVLEDDTRAWRFIRQAAKTQDSLKPKILADPAKVIDELTEFDRGVFDVFQPNTDDPRLNILLGEYMHHVFTGDAAVLEHCHVFKKAGELEKARQDLRIAFERRGEDDDPDLNDWRPGFRGQRPFGLALARAMARRGGTFAICTSMHRHAMGSSVRDAPWAHGWLLFLPLYNEGFVPLEAFLKWTLPIISTTEKNTVEPWQQSLAYAARR